jgi:Tol biopolymer transport system component
MIVLRKRRVLATLGAALVYGCTNDAGCDTSNPLMPVCYDDRAEQDAEQPAVVLASNRDQRFEIYVVNSDGTRPLRLTNNPGADVMPTWSPDRSRIAFASVRGGLGRELFIMNTDGSNQERLTTLGTAPAWPHWSPDGTQIAFNAARGDGNWDIFVMNADGTNIRRLTTTASQIRPRWSPDGSRLAFTWFQHGADCCGRIGLVNVDGTGFQVLPSRGMQDQHPDWSPDGRQIAFSRYVAPTDGMMGFPVLAVMNSDGSGERLFGMSTSGAAQVSWSRKTNRIYFVSDQLGIPQVYSIRPNGGDLKRLSDHMSNDSAPDVR